MLVMDALKHEKVNEDFNSDDIALIKVKSMVFQEGKF